MESAEHVWIGDQLSLQFGVLTKPAKSHYLSFGSGKQLTYGLIIALAGDLYGVVGEPISTASDPRKAFQHSWASLADGDNRELQAILSIMQQEIAALDQAITAEVDPSTTVYASLGDRLSHLWNGATGGSSIGWVPTGRYLQLSSENWDHFSVTAVAAYQAGHRLAMEQAIQARGVMRDQKALERELGLAYAMNAYADHFLTDLFSAGHLRTPRKQIYDRLLSRSPAVLRDVNVGLAGLLVRGMHDEDSRNGLTVTNAAGRTWTAYGDKRLLDAASKDNRAMVVAAAQASADDIANAFMSGQVQEPSALSLIPDLAALAKPGTATDAVNPSPLFTVIDGIVKRRNDMKNTKDYSWYMTWDPMFTYSGLPTYTAPPTVYSHAACYLRKDDTFVGWLGSTRDGNALLARTETDAHGVCWDFEGTKLYLQKDTKGGERWLGLGNRSYASWGLAGGGYNAPVIYNADGTIALKDSPTRLLFLDDDDWLSWTQPGVDNDKILTVALSVLGTHPDC